MRKYAQCSTRDLSGAAATTEVINLRAALASHIHTYLYKVVRHTFSTTCSKHASAFKGSLHTHTHTHTNAHLRKTNTARKLTDTPALLRVESSLHREQHSALLSTHV